MISIGWDSSYRNKLTPWREEEPDVDELILRSGISAGAVLDLGCGTGEWAKALAEKGFDVEGLDYSVEALKIARSQTSSVTWVECDLENLVDYSFHHKKYDLILDHKVLAFIKDIERYLDTIKSRICGVYVLTVIHEHDEKPIICVSKNEFDELVNPRFKQIHSEAVSLRPGKVVATYYLRYIEGKVEPGCACTTRRWFGPLDLLLSEFWRGPSPILN